MGHIVFIARSYCFVLYVELGSIISIFLHFTLFILVSLSLDAKLIQEMRWKVNLSFFRWLAWLAVCLDGLRAMGQ